MRGHWGGAEPPRIYLYPSAPTETLADPVCPLSVPPSCAGRGTTQNEVDQMASKNHPGPPAD